MLCFQLVDVAMMAFGSRTCFVNEVFLGTVMNQAFKQWIIPGQPRLLF